MIPTVVAIVVATLIFVLTRKYYKNQLAKAEAVNRYLLQRERYNSYKNGWNDGMKFAENKAVLAAQIIATLNS